MKAHRRQELKENDLAHFLQETRSYLQEKGSRVLAGAAVIVVVALLAWMVTQSRRRAQVGAWERLGALQIDDAEGLKESLPELRSLADAASDDALGLMVRSKWGEAALRLASAASDNWEKTKHNEDAAAAFESLQERFPDNPLALGVALCGLATVEENRFVFTGEASHQGRAKAYLEQIRDDPRLNGTPFKSQALDRLNLLNETFTTVTFEPLLLPEEGPPAPPAEDKTAEAPEEGEAEADDAVEQNSANEAGQDEPTDEEEPTEEPPDEPGGA